MQNNQGVMMNTALMCLKSILLWFDTDVTLNREIINDQEINWVRGLPFILVHLSCIAIFWVGISITAITFFIAGYLLRMFAITAFYHRYFSHKSYHTNRFWQFIFAFLGATAAQRGPLWWAAHHRMHHVKADSVNDPHSPVLQSFWWCHTGWFLAEKNFKTDYTRVTDLAKYPELLLINRFDMVPPMVYGLALMAIGYLFSCYAPNFHTNAGQLFIYGFSLSTVFIYHATFSINSVAHKFGKRRFVTKDDSRNNMMLAIFALGEGWHNNHHYAPGSAKQGYAWWELDITYLGLLLLKKIGIISDLKLTPQKKRVLI